MVADKLTLLGTYDYIITADGHLAFEPQPDHQRFFLASVNSDAETSRILNRWCKYRLACRRFDCTDVTENYRQRLLERA